MEEGSEVADDGRSIPERRERYGWMLDVVLLEEEPARETENADDERREHMRRGPAVLLSSPAEGDDEEAEKRRAEVSVLSRRPRKSRKGLACETRNART